MGNRQGSNKNRKKDEKKRERDVKKQKGRKKSKNRNSAAISDRDSAALFESSEDVAQGACAQTCANTGSNSQPDVLAGITFDPATRPRDHSSHGAWSSDDEESQLGYSTPLLRTPKTQRSAHDASKTGDLSSGEQLHEVPKTSELPFPQALSSSPGEVRLRHKSESSSPAASPGLTRGDVRKKRALGQALHENGSSKAIEAAIFSAPRLCQTQNDQTQNDHSQNGQTQPGGQQAVKKGTPEINIFGDDRDSLEAALCPWLRDDDDDASIDEDQLDDMFISCIDLSYNMADACSEKEFTGGSEADFSSLETKSKDRTQQRKKPVTAVSSSSSSAAAAAPSCYGEWEGSSVDPVCSRDQTQKLSGSKPQASPVIKTHHFKQDRNKTESEQKSVQQYLSKEDKSSSTEGKVQECNELEKRKLDKQQQQSEEMNQCETTTQDRKTQIRGSAVVSLSNVEAAGSSVDLHEHTLGLSFTEPRGGTSSIVVKQDYNENESCDNKGTIKQPLSEENANNKHNEATKPAKKSGRGKDKKRKKSKTKTGSTGERSVDAESNTAAVNESKQVSGETGECESVLGKTGRTEAEVFGERRTDQADDEDFSEKTKNQVAGSGSAGTSERVDPVFNAQHRFIGDGQTPADFAASVMSSMSEAPASFAVDPSPPRDPQPMSKLVQRITGFIREETGGSTKEETKMVEATRTTTQQRKRRHNSQMTSDVYSQELDSVFLTSDKTNSQTSFESFSQTSLDVESTIHYSDNTEAGNKENMNIHMDGKANPHGHESSKADINIHMDGKTYPFGYAAVTTHTLPTRTTQTNLGLSEEPESSIEPVYAETLQCEQHRGVQYSDHEDRTLSDKTPQATELVTSGQLHQSSGTVDHDEKCYHKVGDHFMSKTQDALPSNSELGKELPGAAIPESKPGAAIPESEPGAVGESVSNPITQHKDDIIAVMCDRETSDIQTTSGNLAATRSDAVPPPSPSAMDALEELDEEADDESDTFSDQKSKEIQMFGDSVLKRLSYLVESQGNESNDESDNSSNKNQTNLTQDVSDVVVVKDESQRGAGVISSVAGPKSRSHDTRSGDKSVPQFDKDTKSAEQRVDKEDEIQRGAYIISSPADSQDRSHDTRSGNESVPHCGKETKSAEPTTPSRVDKENQQSKDKVSTHPEGGVKDADIALETLQGMAETVKVISHKPSTDTDVQMKENTQNVDHAPEQSVVGQPPESQTLDASKANKTDSPPGSDKKSGSGKRKGRSKKAKAKAKAKRLQANASNAKSEISESKSEQSISVEATSSKSSISVEATASQPQTEVSESTSGQPLKMENISKSKIENSKATSEKTVMGASSPKVVMKRPRIPEELTHVAHCDTTVTGTTPESNSDSNPNPPKRESQQITEVIDAYGDVIKPRVGTDAIKPLDKESEQTCPESQSTRKDAKQVDIRQKKENNSDDAKEKNSGKIGSKSKSNPSRMETSEGKESPKTLSKPRMTTNNSDSAEQKMSEKDCPESAGFVSRKDVSEHTGGNSVAVSVCETGRKLIYAGDEVSEKIHREAMSDTLAGVKNETESTPVAVSQSCPQQSSSYSDFVDVNVTSCLGLRSERSPTDVTEDQSPVTTARRRSSYDVTEDQSPSNTARPRSSGDVTEDQSPVTTVRPNVLPLQRVTYDNDNDQTDSRESRESWELSDDADTAEEIFENIDFPAAERQSSSSADSVFRIPDISETFGEMESVKHILDDFEDRTPQAESMPYLGVAGEGGRTEILKSHPDFLAVHRRSRMSPALTNRTESDLDVSEMRDDVSTDSMYADDEEDGPLLFTRNFAEQSGRDVLMTCTIYNSSHNRHDDSDDFWEDCVDEACRQIETSADAATSTFQDARKQMHEIHEHLRTLRLQMESLADDLENATITPQPEFRTESDDKRLITD